MARARVIIGEQARRRVHVQHVLRRRAGAPPRVRCDREGGARPRGVQGRVLQARRTGPQDSSSRLLSAASTSERASLASATAAAANTRRAAGQTLGLPCPRAALAQWFWGGAGRLVISRDQVREQLRYHNNDFLGRANAHHLAVRHSGPSPSKGPARRAPRFLLEFSRRPFTGPRLARPCARDKQGQRQTRARWSGAPAASLSVSLMSHTCSESERCLFASRTCTRRTKYYGPAASLPGEVRQFSR